MNIVGQPWGSLLRMTRNRPQWRNFVFALKGFTMCAGHRLLCPSISREKKNKLLNVYNNVEIILFRENGGRGGR
uniref:Uncharacterized protein n=1 Tax=Arion vulgaris TaxID=1028688 RepID=A0A0B7BRY7_9EUPU